MTPVLVDMSTADWVLSSAGSLLVASAAKATVLLVAVTIVARAMRRSSSALRHQLWLATMIGLTAIPAAALLLPGWQVLPHWAAARVAVEVSQDVLPVESTTQATGERALCGPFVDADAERSADRSDVESVEPDARHGVNPFQVTGTLIPRIDDTLQEPIGSSDEGSSGAPASVVVRCANERGDGASQRAGSANQQPVRGANGHNRSAMLLLLAIWLAGFLVALVPVAAGTISLRRLERADAEPADESMVALARRVAARIGLIRPVAVSVSAHRAMPMTWGIVRPKVLLPECARLWPAERVEAVLLHEFAHVRRRDCLTQFLTRLVCAVHWYHPLVWWAARRLKAEAEGASDDMALSAGCCPSDYAEHLLEIAAASAAFPVGAAAIGMARQSPLERRVRAVLDGRRVRRTATGTSVGCVVLVTALIVPLAVLRSRPSHASAAVPEPDGNPFLNELRVADDLGPVPVRVGYVDDTAEGGQSIAGGAHAVRFRRPANGKYLMAVEVFAHRYGHWTPPSEDFHIYVLDGQRHLIADCPFPYAKIDWGFPRWYTLKLPAVEVPEEYYVVLKFNPAETKGVFVGIDKSVQRSHSYVARPFRDWEPVEGGYDWMVCSVFVSEIPERNPFSN